MLRTHPGFFASLALVTVGLSSCGGESDSDFVSATTGGGAGRSGGSLTGGSGGVRPGTGGGTSTGARSGAPSVGGDGAGGAGSDDGGEGGMAGAPPGGPLPPPGPTDPGAGGSGGDRPLPPGEGGARDKAGPGEGGADGKAPAPTDGGAPAKADPPGEGGAGPGDGGKADACPVDPPAASSDCEGKATCSYADEVCRCDAETSVWECVDFECPAEIPETGDACQETEDIPLPPCEYDDSQRCHCMKGTWSCMEAPD